MRKRADKPGIGNKAAFAVLLLLLCIFITAGNAIAAKPAVYAADGQVAPYVDNLEADKNSVEVRKEKVVETWEEFEASPFPLIAAIPERDIYLYGIKTHGVILYVKGIGHYYEWEYITPRFIFPRMYVSDFDSDSKEELAVMLYIGSGTGYGVEDLHMVEIAEEEVLSREPSSKDYFVPNPEYYRDHFFKPEDYIARLNEQVTLKVYHKKDELMVDVKTAGVTSTVSLKQLQSIEQGISVNNMPCFGNIVSFEMEDGKLIARFVLAVTCDAFASPFSIGEVFAEVGYTKDRFILTNLYFKADEELMN